MLNIELPIFDPILKKVNGKPAIYDMIRKRYVALTPEEYVRQSIINFLTTQKNYPSSLINVESAFNYNNQLYRADIIVYDRNGDPYLLVECKTFKAKLSIDSLGQSLMYNRCIKSRYVLVSNGQEHYGYSLSEDMEYSEIYELPEYPV